MHRQEHAPLAAVTAAMPQMFDDRLADVAGQRELVAPVGLAVDDDLPRAPIEMVAPQSRDLDSAQPQPREQKQHRESRARRVAAVNGAKTAGELYGCTIVVFAAQHYASQLVLANSKRRASVLPRSHKDTARKAFEGVTKKVLPGSYTRLQRALNAEARDYESKVAEVETRVRADRTVLAAQNADAGIDEEPQHGDEVDDDLEDDGD